MWLVPFAYFISLSINEFVLPCEFPSYKQQQQDSYAQVALGIRLMSSGRVTAGFILLLGVVQGEAEDPG